MNTLEHNSSFIFKQTLRRLSLIIDMSSDSLKAANRSSALSGSKIPVAAATRYFFIGEEINAKFLESLAAELSDFTLHVVHVIRFLGPLQIARQHCDSRFQLFRTLQRFISRMTHELFLS